jgi:hypothetical protein
MRVRWREGFLDIDPACSRADRIVSRIYWGVLPKDAGKDTGNEQTPIEKLSLEILTQRNLIVLGILALWGIYYFTLQFHTPQEPYYGDGWFFSTQPNSFLQDHRHVALDYFLSYSWVIIFISVGSLYYLVALSSEREFWRYGLAFWATWLTQYTLQMFVNLASPIRNSETGLVFIREEVFPWSENLVGMKYGAFPSGHIGVTLLVFMIARDRGAPWIQKAAIGCLIIMFWAILYLGEHYLVDAVASAILYPILYLIITRKVFPEERGKDPRPMVGAQMSEV